MEHQNYLQMCRSNRAFRWERQHLVAASGGLWIGSRRIPGRTVPNAGLDYVHRLARILSSTQRGNRVRQNGTSMEINRLDCEFSGRRPWVSSSTRIDPDILPGSAAVFCIRCSTWAERHPHQRHRSIVVKIDIGSTVLELSSWELASKSSRYSCVASRRCSDIFLREGDLRLLLSSLDLSSNLR